MAAQQVRQEINAVLALDETLDNLGGDPGLLRELLEYFLEVMPAQLDDLQSSVAAGDLADVDLQAHSIKGGAANVGAVRVAALARDLEQRAKSGTLDGAGELVDAIRQAFCDVQGAVPCIDWSALV